VTFGPRPASLKATVILTRTLGKQGFGKGYPLLSSLLFFLSISGFAQSSSIEDSSYTGGGQTKISVTANLVLLPVKVTDGHGASVNGLTLQNFRVYEDGRLANVTVFEEGDTPITVGLIVDHSRSMGSKLPEVGIAVSSFAHSSNPQDEMFVVDFNDNVSIERVKGKPFSNDPNDLEEALTAVAARGRTALYDAVSAGLSHLRDGRWPKKALIIISDGGDNASKLKYSQVLAQARESQTLIYSIGLVGSDSADENPGVLRKLCKDTGGIAYFPQVGESVASVSAEIARDLREQYTLGFVPQNTTHSDAFRKVEVKVSVSGHGKLRVRTRQGYSFGAEEHPSAQVVPGT
jgi:Ca-activated chloride channel homolog